MVRNLSQKLLISIGLGLIVVFVVSFSADAPKLLGVLSGFQWQLAPLILSLTLLNYFLRFVKWHYYLRVLNIRNISLGQSAMIFTAGLSMVMTPGKMGELLKSYLVRKRAGTPMTVSAPIIFAERLTDGIAMIILGSVGLVAYGIGQQILVAALVGAVAVVVVTQNRSLLNRLTRLLGRIPFLSTRIHHVEATIESANQLFRLRHLILTIGMGVISWGGESAAFYLILLGLGLQPSLTLLVQATFILAASTLVGAASMLPGGLAASEGSIAGLLLVLGVTHDAPIAAAATLLIRFATLWFGVLVGLVGLLIVAGQLGDGDSAELSAGASRAPTPAETGPP